MSLKFDATLKETVREYVPGYAVRFGLPAGKPAHLVDVDLSTLTAATDSAIAIGDPVEEIADLNFQSGPDPKLPERVLLYNSALHHRCLVPVRSIVILIDKRADRPNLTGILAYGEGEYRLEFRYKVVRLWEETPESFLNGSIGLAPLAILSQLPADYPEAEAANQIAKQIESRLVAELPHDRAVVLMKATMILAQLRYKIDNYDRVFQGVGLMGEMVTADYFAEQGAIRDRREVLFDFGQMKFGRLNEADEDTLNSITDLDRLKRMSKAIFSAKDWQEVLNTP